MISGRVSFFYFEYIFLILLLLRILVRPTDSVVAVLVVAVPYLGGDSPGPAERSTITYLFFVLRQAPTIT